ncbi:MAG: PDZ domain-containing protein [Gemmatimonadetes bacterium]|nr:PDZ domain-containing protein [Gemmatimonadota bacterium]
MLQLRRLAAVPLSIGLAAAASAQGREGRAPLRSAPITAVSYTVAFTAANGVDRALDVTMRFTAAGRDPVLLSLPVWTPGAYEVSNYARYVSKFGATARGKSLHWDKADPDTWRIDTDGGGDVTVSFRFKADTLDNAGSWARDEFALFNGTNVFMYAEGRPLDFPATVTVRTEPAWRVETGMPRSSATTWHAATYHELVDHPFFVGRFDLDSAQVDGAWLRLASYPAGLATPARRARLFDQLARAIPKESAVFGGHPWTTYDVMQIADSGFGGMSALEHENSNVAIVGAQLLDEDFVPSVYAHEIFHAFNVKRLRPADMYPYRYDVMQPTPWLWVSEGITDYYADLALVRGGVVTPQEFLGTTQRKMDHVAQLDPVSLEDASLQTWLHMTDGTSDIYYDKGSLAGLALDIQIRDASDNAAGLDDVMRDLYQSAYRHDRGFTADEWWGAVSRAANGMKFADFASRYVDGREPYPWTAWLAKAGWRVTSDTTREPRFGVSLQGDSAGLRVMQVDAGGSAAAAGIQPGDVLTSIDGIPVSDPAWQGWRVKFAHQEGAPVAIGLLRGRRPMQITAKVKLATLIEQKLEADPAATPKAKRIREGILKGETRRPPK